MPKTFYVRSKLLASLSSSQRKLYQIALHRFLEGSNGANLEKLQNSSFYSIRVNQCVRLFLSRVQREGTSYWLWVDVMDDHNYKKALSNTNHWLNCQQDQMQEYPFEIEMNKDDASDEGLVTLQEAPIQLRNQGFILLDSHQQQVKPSKLPLIVTGPPGAGKSCLAPSLLLQYIEQSFIQEKQYLVYLAQSNALVALMRTEWVEHAELNQVDANRFEVLFLTMEDLYKHPICGNTNAALHLVSEEHFDSWLKRCNKIWETQVDKVYQECRTMSGYSQFKDYVTLENSTYSIDDRQTIWGIYQSYLGHLNTKKCIHLPFHAFKSPHLFDFMIVDEAQDGSRLQLRALAGLVKGQRICYLVGDHQRLVGNESTVPFLKSIFFDTGSTASHESLHTSYRCSLKVVELANAILQLKYRAIGGSLVLDKNELLHMTASLPDVVGNVHWLKDEDALQPLERDNENAEFAVITSLKFKPEAQERFGADRVFIVEEIKGLEYEHVLLYRILDQDPFKAANKTIGPDFILYKNPSEQEITKRGEGSLCYNTAFNELFVSATRAKLSVSIYQPKCPMTRNICNALERFCNSTPSIGHSQDIAVHSSASQWQLRADRLREQGLEQHASAVEQRIKPSKQHIPTPTPTVSPTLVTKKNQKTPHPVVTKPPELHGHLKTFYQLILKKDLSVIKKLLNHAHAEALLFNISLNSVDASWPKFNLYSVLLVEYEMIFSKAINNLPPKNAIRRHWSETFIYSELQTQHPDVTKIRAALVSVDINKIYGEKYTLLYIATHKGHPKVIQELLKQKGIDVNYADENGSTPLLIVVRQRYLEVVPLLLNHKEIDINKPNKSGFTPLYIAATQGYLEIAKELLKQEKIDVNKADGNGSTPLHVAAHNGDLKIVQELLNQKGIDINIRDIDGMTPLYLAAQRGHLEVVQEFLKQKGIDVDQADSYGLTPLYAAAQEDHLKVVQELLKQEGIKFDNADVNGITPLFIAAQKGYIKTVQELLKREGIDINKANKNGVTVLCIAVANAHYEVVLELLKQKGIDINQGEENGLTPLHIAVDKGPLKTVQALLRQKETKINNPDNNGLTPLCIAAYMGDINVLKELLKQEGIDVNQADKKGMTPLNLALERGDPAMVQELLKQEGIDINKAGNDGFIPLHIVAKSGHMKCIHALVTAGADIHIPIVLPEKRLIAYFQKENEQVRNSLSQFIIEYKKNLKKSYNPSFHYKAHEDIMIEMKSIEVAEIMGHGHIVQFLRRADKTNQEALRLNSAFC